VHQRESEDIMTPQRLLDVRNVSKRFGGVTALNGISFHVEHGEVLGLIGPNGAGKSTLFNVISGLLPPTGGEIVLGGRALAGMRPDQVSALGAVRTFQSASLLVGMSVWDNVHVASLFRSGHARAAEDASACTARAIAYCGLQSRIHAAAESLTIGEQKRVEIARCIATAPRLVMTDEILAGLNPADSESILEMLLGLKKQGMSLIFVEHDVRSVMRISDRVVVIAQGRKLTEGRPQEVARDPQVIEVYLGGRYAQRH
jgi:branched-chain amino acid transport system ATP-binding protein